MNETQREIAAALGVGHAKHKVRKWLVWGVAVAVLGALGFWWMQGAESRSQVTYILPRRLRVAI